MELLERDVKALNLKFLTLCREYARFDKTICAEKFGLDRRVVDRIGRLTMDELETLANSPSFQFQPRSTVALDVLLAALIMPGVTTEQFESLRAAANLSEDKVREASA